MTAPDPILNLPRSRTAPATPVDIVRSFRRLRALVIGDAMLDTYLEGTASRLCREGPVPVVRKTGEEQQPGGAANSAANLSALGADVTFLSVVGADAAGETLRRALVERGVDDRAILVDPRVSTHHKLRILANDQYMVRFDAGESSSLSPESERRLQTLLEEACDCWHVVVIADYGYGVVSDALLQRLRALREQHPCPLVVDAKDLRRFRSAGATLMTPNHAEARAAVDAAPLDAPPRIPEVERVGRRVLAAVDCQQVAITMADQGVLLLDRQTSLHLPAHPVARANDVGAGDSFTAAAALALGAGADTEMAVRIGIDAAGIAVARPRTAVIRQQELLQRVSLRCDVAPGGVAALASQLERDRAGGKRIVFTNGVFDILHAGHVSFLREASQLGDLLVVAINNDASVRRLKGRNRPINTLRDRMALVGSLDSVDHVIDFDDDTPENIIRALCPHIHVKGGDYAAEDIPEAAAVREIGGQVVVLPLYEGTSTSGVIDRIVDLAR